MKRNRDAIIGQKSFLTFYSRTRYAALLAYHADFIYYFLFIHYLCQLLLEPQLATQFNRKDSISVETSVEKWPTNLSPWMHLALLLVQKQVRYSFR